VKGKTDNRPTAGSSHYPEAKARIPPLSEKKKKKKKKIKKKKTEKKDTSIGRSMAKPRHCLFKLIHTTTTKKQLTDQCPLRG